MLHAPLAAASGGRGGRLQPNLCRIVQPAPPALLCLCTPTAPLPCGISVLLAGATWQPSLVDHGWYFSVEPFTGMAIQGHKVRMRRRAVQSRCGVVH